VPEEAKERQRERETETSESQEEAKGESERAIEPTRPAEARPAQRAMRV
jgi:hypothetical protein